MQNVVRDYRTRQGQSDTQPSSTNPVAGRILSTTDLWSDPNLAPFMAVTAHWMEATTVQTSDGPQHLINLWTDFIGFYQVTGHHNGERLATVFMKYWTVLRLLQR